MEQFSIGFWGCYFGSVVLILTGSIFAFIRKLHLIAFNTVLSAIASGFFVIAFLGMLPIDEGDNLARFLAHVASLVSALLTYLLLSFVNVSSQRKSRLWTITGLSALTATVMAIGWLIPPLNSLALSTSVACALGVAALCLAVRNALRGERNAWALVLSIFCMLVALIGLSWIALDRLDAPWQVHVISAIAGTIYMVTIASVLWTRYSYLIELRQAMVQGPSYDPVTRMRSHSETGNMVGTAFKNYRNDAAPMGVIVISIANLYVLEKLYGLSVMNHALFVCAGRLRRTVPAHVEMGRLADDGFLLLVKDCDRKAPLILLAREVQAILSKTMALSMSQEGGSGRQENLWAAEVGAGVLKVSRTDARAATAVAIGRGMSRTAWTYPSRVTWYDDKKGEIIGVPVC